MIKSIWSTAEAESWSRSFSYSDYLQMCTAMNWIALSEDKYKEICELFNVWMERDNG